MNLVNMTQMQLQYMRLATRQSSNSFCLSVYLQYDIIHIHIHQRCLDHAKLNSKSLAVAQ